jgi:mRNA (guanine-N7-)-methyltransferase
MLCHGKPFERRCHLLPCSFFVNAYLSARLAEDYNLELQYRKPFPEVWREEKNHPELGPLSERMGVYDRYSHQLAVTEEEMEAASFYHAFCFYKV